MTIDNAFKDALKQGVADTLLEGYRKGRTMSSGTVSYLQLALEDHPYARRHGSPLRPPEIINSHRGEFYNGWMISDPVETAGDITGSVENHSLTSKGRDLSDYLTQPRGWPTTRMFQRPIDKEVETQIESSLDDKVQSAISEMFAQDFYI